jgi:putrescine transport system substrate-binding protein
MSAVAELVSSLRAASIVGTIAALAGCSAATVNQPVAQAPSLLIPRGPIPRYDTDEEKILRITNWKDYIDPLVLAEFTGETGIKVEYDNLVSNDSLDAAMRAGRSGYDVVFPSGKFLQAQVALGLYRALDKSRLTNLGNLDHNMSGQLARFDPGNAHAVNYLFGTVGITYNVEAVAAAMPNAPLDSLAMIWDPWVVSKFAHCGVAIFDVPSEVVGTVLIYLGKDPNSEKLEDLAAAEKVMLAARPSIRLINSDYINELIAGEICLGLDWSGDALHAKVTAENEGKPFEIGYRLPREGAVIFLDTMAIPQDASHVKNAHIFIDYMLRDAVAARNSRFTTFPNGNAMSWLVTGDDLVDDQNFFPPPSRREKLAPDLPESEAFNRQLMRAWARFVAGGKRR